MGVSLLAESWTWWTVCTLIYVVRIFARFWKKGEVQRHDGTTKFSFMRGLRCMKIEDYLMFLAWSFYTADIVTMNITSQQQSNLLPPGYLSHHTLSPSERSAREYGSIMTVVVEQCQICTIWLIKICVLMMWHTLTEKCLRRRNQIVVSIGVYVIFAWVLMETLYFAVWCRPFSAYFAVPTPNPQQCAAAWNHLITNAVCNLSSDLMLLGVSLTIVFDKDFRGTRRLALAALCALGLFVIVCACLNKAYSWHNPYGSQWTFWYIREASTAVLLASFPYVWSIARLYGGGGRRRSYGSTVPANINDPSHRPSRWERTLKTLRHRDIELSSLPSARSGSATTNSGTPSDPPPGYRSRTSDASPQEAAHIRGLQQAVAHLDEQASEQNEFHMLTARSAERAAADDRTERRKLANWSYGRSEELPREDVLDLRDNDFRDVSLGVSEFPAGNVSRANEPRPPKKGAMARLRNHSRSKDGWTTPPEWDGSAGREGVNMRFHDPGNLMSGQR